MQIFWTICAIQFLVILTLAFGDIGFDKPGRFGLDFDHLVILIFTQVCLFIAAASMIIRTKRWYYFGVQFLLLIVTVAGFIVGDR